MNLSPLILDLEAWLESCPPRTDRTTITLLQRAAAALREIETLRASEAVRKVADPEHARMVHLEAIAPGTLLSHLLYLLTEGDPDRSDIEPPPPLDWEDTGSPPYVRLMMVAGRPGVISMHIHRAGYLMMLDLPSKQLLLEENMIGKLEEVISRFNKNLSDPKASGVPFARIPGFKEVTDEEERQRVTGHLKEITDCYHGSRETLSEAARTFAEVQFGKFDNTSALRDIPLDHLTDKDVARLYINALEQFLSDNAEGGDASS